MPPAGEIEPMDGGASFTPAAVSCAAVANLAFPDRLPKIASGLVRGG